jgi:hypothetical protein
MKTLKIINGKPVGDFWKEVGDRQAKFEAWSKGVAGLRPEEQVEAVAKKLQEVNPGFDGKVTRRIENGLVEELRFLTDNVTDISPVRGLSSIRSLVCSGSEPDKGRLTDLYPLVGLALERLDCSRTQVADLSPLKSMRLRYLDCSVTGTGDLSPLQGMPLSWLNCQATEVRDLSPLRSTQLTGLICFGTSVSDLSPLKGQALERLEFGAPVTDLGSISRLPLKAISFYDFNFNRDRDGPILRSIKTLEKINNMPLAEFWKEAHGSRPEATSAARMRATAAAQD